LGQKKYIEKDKKNLNFSKKKKSDNFATLSLDFLRKSVESVPSRL